MLILCVEHEVAPFLGAIINIDDIVLEANKIFLEVKGLIICKKNSDKKWAFLL